MARSERVSGLLLKKIGTSFRHSGHWIIHSLVLLIVIKITQSSWTIFQSSNNEEFHRSTKWMMVKSFCKISITYNNMNTKLIIKHLTSIIKMEKWTRWFIFKNKSVYSFITNIALKNSIRDSIVSLFFIFFPAGIGLHRFWYMLRAWIH